MEIQLIMRFSLPDAAHSDMVQELLGMEGPAFDTEVPRPYRAAFRALEQLFPPDDVKQVSATTLEVSWLVGTDLEDVLAENAKALTKAGASKIAAYHWADEEEGFWVYKKNKLTRKPSWRKQLEELNIKPSASSDRWISRYLAHLQKQDFQD
jgi:hypothetical protein